MRLIAVANIYGRVIAVRLNFLLPFLFLFFIPHAHALETREIICNQTSAYETDCDIHLFGRVESGDVIYISSVNDSDFLYHENNILGSTGHYAGREFYARFLPRAYSLDPVAGKESIVLRLKAKSFFNQDSGLPRKPVIKIINQHHFLARIYSRVFFQAILFLTVILSFLYLFSWAQEKTLDGWNYPNQELRWFFGSLSFFILLEMDLAKIIVPSLIKKESFELMQSLSLSVCLWALGILLLQGIFRVRSSLEKGIFKKVPKYYLRAVEVSFLLSLAVLSLPIDFDLRKKIMLAAQSLSIAAVAWRAMHSTDWRRVVKRSVLISLCFQFSLYALASVYVLVALAKISFNFEGHQFLVAACYICLSLGMWRQHKTQNAFEESMEFADICREKLSHFSSGEQQLQAFCDLIQEDTSAARVSLIAVQNEHGLLIASAGPDAIKASFRSEPRRLGPFLRRVCKEGHMLYAPVAEELGKDLQEQGLKHSSLALPLFQNDKILAVLCVMADEDESIAPFEANVLESLTQILRLEILTAVLNYLTWHQKNQLFAIANASSGIAVEYLDIWGRLQIPSHAEKRMMIHASITNQHPEMEWIRNTPTLEKLRQMYLKELHAIWFSLREAFEFLAKDSRRDDFWCISPKQFNNPVLQELGAEKACIYLSIFMEKNARTLAMREDYRALGISGASIAFSFVPFQMLPVGNSDVLSMNMDSAEFLRLEKARSMAHPGEVILYCNDSQLIELIDNAGFQTKKCKITCDGNSEKLFGNHEIFSILSLPVDKKDLRKLELHALETAKESIARKKSA